MNIDCCLIKSFYIYSYYIKYNKYINNIYIKNNNKDLFKIYQSLVVFHERFPAKDISSTADLELFFYSQYPALNQRDKDSATALFQAIDEAQFDNGLVEVYIKAYRERQMGHRMALAGLEVSQGQKTWKDAQNTFESILEDSQEFGEDLEKSPFVTTNLSEIYNRTVAEVGLRWPLSIMNKMMGSLRKGDFGFIFARPEIGKTTMIAHIATHMAMQAKKKGLGPVLWFNNEQEGHVVQNYCYRSGLGLTNEQLYAKIEENDKTYNETVGDHLRIFDSALIHRSEVESLCREYQPSLIVFDQIDKLRGFDEDRNDLELGAIYQWARELAKRYCPTIGVCQAGESGANKRYLTMEDVVNAKTSKQAEADWILGIGKVEQEGYENVRFLHLSKNKLQGDSDTLSELRHGKQEVLILPALAQYKDIA